MSPTCSVATTRARRLRSPSRCSRSRSAKLPQADDDFAQIASQFDTIGELRADLRAQLEKSKEFAQAIEARDKIVDVLLEKLDLPVPQQLIDDEVHRHLENENRLEDDAHRAEVIESSTKTFRQQILLDSIAEAEEVKVGQNELTSYVVQASQQYGMDPAEFLKVLDSNGQLPGVVGEIARSKALAIVLSKAKVVDTKNKAVDVSAFVARALGDGGLDDGDSGAFSATSTTSTTVTTTRPRARPRVSRRQGHARPQAGQRALRPRPQVVAPRIRPLSSKTPVRVTGVFAFRCRRNSRTGEARSMPRGRRFSIPRVRSEVRGILAP